MLSFSFLLFVFFLGTKISLYYMKFNGFFLFVISYSTLSFNIILDLLSHYSGKENGLILF